MATRSMIYIKKEGTDKWYEVYCHWDGQPHRMLPALNAHSPEDILRVADIKYITTDEIAQLPDPQPLRTSSHFPVWPQSDIEYCYVLTPDGWKAAENPKELVDIYNNLNVQRDRPEVLDESGLTIERFKILSGIK